MFPQSLEGASEARGCCTPSRLRAHATPRLMQALPTAALPEGSRAQRADTDRAVRALGRHFFRSRQNKSIVFQSRPVTMAPFRLLCGLAFCCYWSQPPQPPPERLAASPVSCSPQRSEQPRTQGAALAPALSV